MKQLSQIRITQSGELVAIDNNGNVAKGVNGTIGELIVEAAVNAGFDPDGALIESSYVSTVRVVKEGKGFRIESA